jgi:hypothetical protein
MNKTLTIGGLAAAAALAVASAVTVSRPATATHPRFRAEERIEVRRDAGVLFRGESPCCRERNRSPECAELIVQNPGLCP